MLFDNWRRLTVLLPLAAVSNNTQIRWRQAKTDKSDWAIDNVYFGENKIKSSTNVYFCIGYLLRDKPYICHGLSEGARVLLTRTFNQVADQELQFRRHQTRLTRSANLSIWQYIVDAFGMYCVYTLEMTV